MEMPPRSLASHRSFTLSNNGRGIMSSTYLGKLRWKYVGIGKVAQVFSRYSANVYASGRRHAAPLERPAGGALRASPFRIFLTPGRIVPEILAPTRRGWAAFECPHPTLTAPSRSVWAGDRPYTPTWRPPVMNVPAFGLGHGTKLRRLALSVALSSVRRSR